MILVRLELLSAVTGEVKDLGVAEIANDGKGSVDLGDYNVRLYKWGGGRRLWRQGHVTGFPRKTFGPWDLLAIGLIQALGKDRMMRLCDTASEGKAVGDQEVF